MAMRYMGTKRHIADRVRRLMVDLHPDGRVLDLFSGMGCVANEMAGFRSVVTNDSLAFTGALARARFRGSHRTQTAAGVIESLRGDYRARYRSASRAQAEALRLERRALDLGATATAEYMDAVQHVGNSEAIADQARVAARSSGTARYQLAALYFAGGYFSLRQTLQLDALRYAIDSHGTAQNKDWLLGAWLTAAATLINAPGHTAQFLRPNSDQAHDRLKRYWRRSVWTEFQVQLSQLNQVGTTTWRKNNRVVISDAQTLLSGEDIKGLGAVYADPPYTKDQYSRYYHVYETLYRYNFPSSHGRGRAPGGRVSTEFCLKSGVDEAFRSMMQHVAARGLPLVLSYPSNGLLHTTGAKIEDIVDGSMKIVAVESFPAKHSTLGASKGSSTKDATENLYVCRPSY